MTPLMDLEAIDTLIELGSDDPKFLKKLIGLYLSEMPVRLDKLSSEYQSRNAQGVSQASHALVSASQNIGAVRLAELSQELERQARSENLESADQLILKIKETFSDTKKFLDEILIKHS